MCGIFHMFLTVSKRHTKQFSGFLHSKYSSSTLFHRCVSYVRNIQDQSRIYSFNSYKMCQTGAITWNMKGLDGGFSIFQYFISAVFSTSSLYCQKYSTITNQLGNFQLPAAPTCSSTLASIDSTWLTSKVQQSDWIGCRLHWEAKKFLRRR